jgi:hypothetical protein
VIAKVNGKDAEGFTQLLADGLPVIRGAEQAVKNEHRVALAEAQEMELHAASFLWRRSSPETRWKRVRIRRTAVNPGAPPLRERWISGRLPRVRKPAAWRPPSGPSRIYAPAPNPRRAAGSSIRGRSRRAAIV